MKIPYSYAVLRYVHDAVSGEFANVGVILYAPEVRHVAFKGSAVYDRLSEFFPGMDGDHFRRMIDSVQSRVSELATGSFQASTDAKSAFEIGKKILPLDDSSLRFAEGGSGITSDLPATLERVCERYVERYSTSQHRRRSDEMVSGN
jgi:hypothetical protein